MQFSIIYSVDCPRSVSIKPYVPPHRKLWDQTEGDEQFEYGYLEGDWEKGKHRKWCAILNQEQFEDFIRKCDLVANDCGTGGAIGSPAFGYGWAPAISFDGDDPDAITNAYVTPLPDGEPREITDEEWEAMREEVIETYGRNGSFV